MKITTNRVVQQGILLLLCCLLSFTAISQKKETALRKIYLQGGLGGSSYNGFVGDAAVQAVFKKNLVTTFSFHSFEMDAKNLPSDYTPEISPLNIFVPFSYGAPSTALNTFSLTAGKIFEKGRKFWFTTEAGISIVTGDKYTYTRQPVVQALLYYSSNYSAKKETKTSVGVLLKADATWAFSSFMGLGVGVFGNFNGIQSPVGFDVKLIAGWMNRKPKVSKSTIE